MNEKSAEFPIEKRNCFCKLFICLFSVCLFVSLSHECVCTYLCMLCIFVQVCFITASIYSRILPMLLRVNTFFGNFYFSSYLIELCIRVPALVPATRFSFTCSTHQYWLKWYHCEWNAICIRACVHVFLCVCADNFLFHRHRLFVRRCVDVDIYERSNTLPIYFGWEIGWIVSNICCWYVLMHSAFAHVHFNCKHSFALTNANMMRCNRLKSY